MANQFLEAALKYAKLGWKVFPCIPRQKQPITRHGCKDATDDAEQIRAWWRMHPSANVAVATGEGSGVSVLDIDTKGVNGWETVNAIMTERGEKLPVTIMAGTPTGGAHLFFTAKDHPGCKVGFKPSLDIRGNGGYVLVAPSVHPNGKVYEWTPGFSPWEAKPVAFPEYLLPAARTAPEPQVKGEWNCDSAKSPSTPSITGNDRRDRAIAYLRECEPAVQGGGGHAKLLWAATALVHGFELSDSEAYDLLATVYNPLCDPPWNLSDPADEKDFRRKIGQARTKPPSKARGWLLDDDMPVNVMTDDQVLELISNSKANTPTEPDGLPGIDRDGELAYLSKPVGVIGEICSWVESQADRHQPWLTIACVLSMAGAVLGRRVKAGKTRSNLFTIGVAATSAGKSNPMRQCCRILTEAGCGEMIGGRGATSDSAIEKLLYESPSLFLPWDEIGLLLAGFKQGGQHTGAIVPFLMSIHSASNSDYRGKDRAMEESRLIKQPCLSIFGSTTPGRFTQALDSDELDDGWVARCLIFSVDGVLPPLSNHDDKPIPERIVEWVKFWRSQWDTQRAPVASGDIAAATGRHNEGPEVEPYPIDVPVTAVANRMFSDIDEEFRRRSEEEDMLAGIWGKAQENARKIALIIACGNDTDNPRIDENMADYACRMVRFILADFERFIAPRLNDNAVTCTKQKVVRIIGGYGAKGVKKGDLTRKTQFLSGDQARTVCLRDLIDAGLIFSRKIKVGGNQTCDYYWTPRNYAKWLEQNAK